MTVAPVNGYCTLADLKSPDVLDTPVQSEDDALLCDIITAVSRFIDKSTSRYFYKSGSSETRYFTARQRDKLFTGDLVSITTLATDTLDGSRGYPYTWALTDYDLWPYNDSAGAEPAPYRYVDVTLRGANLFPVGVPRGVKIIGVFGWPAIPSTIAKACLLQSGRLFDRYKTRLGISATTSLGQMVVKVPGLDPDVDMLISSYKAPAV